MSGWRKPFPTTRSREVVLTQSNIMRNSKFLLTIFFLIWLSASACAQNTSQTPAPKTTASPDATDELRAKNVADPNKFALIISGAGGEEEYIKKFDVWANDLRTALVSRLGFAAENVTTLTEKNEQAKATAAEVTKAFAALKSNCKPDHTVFIFFIGHGSVDNGAAKFLLVGRDLAATEYGTLIKSLPAKRVVVVNMASSSGDFIKPLTAPGHVTITATRSGQENNATHFPEYFIAALKGDGKKWEADADQNQRLSVLEAFDYANKLTEKFFKEQNRLQTEHALLDDNGDGKGSEKIDQGDGSLAKNTFFDSMLYQLAGGDAELQKLFADRIKLETEIEILKARKAEMKIEDYENELEKLLLQMAELNEKIKARQK